MIYCTEVADKFDLKEGCCSSCHEDEEEYGYDMCEFELPSGETVHVCCRIANEYRKKCVKES